MDLNPHLKLGWSPLHDACFKGNTPVISKLVSYGKENGKNLIELETSDEYSKNKRFLNGKIILMYISN